MNRRQFISGLVALFAAEAAKEIIPSNRVWSFPSKIVIAKRLPFDADMQLYGGARGGGKLFSMYATRDADPGKFYLLRNANGLISRKQTLIGKIRITAEEMRIAQSDPSAWVNHCFDDELSRTYPPNKYSPSGTAESADV